MLFSTTGGSTYPLPSDSISHPSFFSSPHLYLVFGLSFSSGACCSQVQVAGCNLSNMSPSPFCTHSSARPHVYIPLSIFGQLRVLLLSFLFCPAQTFPPVFVCVCMQSSEWSTFEFPSTVFPSDIKMHERALSRQLPVSAGTGCRGRMEGEEKWG